MGMGTMKVTWFGALMFVGRVCRGGCICVGCVWREGMNELRVVE